MLVTTELLKELQPIAKNMGEKYIGKSGWAAGLRSDEICYCLDMVIPGYYVGMLEALVAEKTFYEEFKIKHNDWHITEPNKEINKHGIKGIDFIISKGDNIKTIDVKTGQLLVHSKKVDNAELYVFCSYFLNAGNSYISGCITAEDVKKAPLGFNRHKDPNYQLIKDMLKGV
jgi:hypothetical protein